MFAVLQEFFHILSNTTNEKKMRICMNDKTVRDSIGIADYDQSMGTTIQFTKTQLWMTASNLAYAWILHLLTLIYNLIRHFSLNSSIPPWKLIHFPLPQKCFSSIKFYTLHELLKTNSVLDFNKYNLFSTSLANSRWVGICFFSRLLKNNCIILVAINIK